MVLLLPRQPRSMMRRLVSIATVAVLCLFPTATTAQGNTGNGTLTIYELAQAEDSLETFRMAVILADLGDTLNDSTAGPFTVLAPQDEAFESVDGRYLEPEWKDYLVSLLSFHVLIGSWPSSSLEENSTLPTAFSDKIVRVTEKDPLTFEESGMVMNGNFDASNGVMHIINSVLLPPNMALSLLDQAASDASLSRFVELVTELDLTPTLSQPGPFTLLIPTNEAFDKIPPGIFGQLDVNALTQILLYHVLPQIQFAYTLSTNAPRTLTTMHSTTLDLNRDGVVDQAAFVTTDTMASNGVWHSIDTLLLPVVTTVAPAAPAPAPTQAAVPTPVPAPTSPTIFDTAASVASLSDFTNAVILADLQEPLSSPGPITVFAPNDDAFSALPLKLYEPRWKLHLASFLSYHIVPLQSILTSDLALAQELPTAQGASLTVTQISPTYVLNNHAMVVTENVETSNGILHAIDSLLLPPWVMTTVSQIVTNDVDLTRLTELLSAHDLLGVLGMEGPYTLLAPVNAAFDKVPISVVLDELDFEGRVEILSYHIIPELVTSEQMINGATFLTLQGTSVKIMSATIRQSSEIRIHDASVIRRDELAQNGMIHYLDTVLIPVVETPEPTGEPTVTPMPTMRPTMGTVAPTTIKPTGAPSEADPISPPGSTTAPTIKADDDGDYVMMSLAETIMYSEDHTVLGAALNVTNLYNPLEDMTNNLTVLAPTDAGFIASGLNLTQYLLPEWRSHLTALLTYHVLIGPVLSSQLEEDMMAPTLNGNSITVTEVDGDTITINNVTVEMADIIATNGIIHVLDNVLLPPSALYGIPERASMIPTLSSFVRFLEETELDFSSTSGPYTVFAPSNSFDMELEEVLMSAGVEELTLLLAHHVVPGMYPVNSLQPGQEFTTLAGSTFVLDADHLNLISTNNDILANNGIIHEVDFVLTVPVVPTAAPVETPTRPPTMLVSINQLLIGNPDYSTLSAALNATGLNVALDSEAAELTLFAPTNAAFVNSGLDLENQYLQPEWASHLASLLSYHVVIGTLEGDNLEDGMMVPTLEGTNLTVTASGNGFNINGASITNADLGASNGVVHGLSGVLFPPSASNTIVDLAAKESEMTILVSALNSTGLLSVLAEPGPYTVFLPTNQGFIESNAPLSDDDEMLNILSYHVVDGIYTSQDLFPDLSLPTLEGSDIVITDFGMVNGANIVTSDILANNGVIHVIDAVLSMEETIDPTLTTTTYMPSESSADTMPTPTMVPPQAAPSPEPTVMETGAPTMFETDTETADFSAIPAAEAPAGPLPTVLDLVSGRSEFTVMSQLLSDSGVASTLTTTGPFTVFAPNQAGFEDLPADVTAQLLQGEALVQALSYHVVSGTYVAADLEDGMVLTTLQGGNITISVDGDDVSIQDSNGNTVLVVVGDSMGSNGVVHEISGVLVPVFDSSTPAPSSAPMTTDMTSAPTADMTMVATDMVTGLPDDLLTDAPSDRVGNLLEAVTGLDETSSFVALLTEAADLADLLTEPGPFTLLVPMDSAFSSLPDGYLDSLSEQEKVDLVSYHVIPGTFSIDELQENTELTTLHAEFAITFAPPPSASTPPPGFETLAVNNSTVFADGDYDASNGVVHLISSIVFAPSSSGDDDDMVYTDAPTEIALESAASGRTGSSFECNDRMIAVASACCPMQTPGLASFCQDLYERSVASSNPTMSPV